MLEAVTRLHKTLEAFTVLRPESLDDGSEDGVIIPVALVLLRERYLPG